VGIGLSYLDLSIRARGTGFISPVPVIPNAPPNGQVGLAYSYTPFTFGGSPPYTYALTGSLPAGLTFHTGTGVIDGTPTTAGTSSGLTITATDSIAGTGSVGPFSIIIVSGGGNAFGLLLALTQ
jgi:hypothetical protein